MENIAYVAADAREKGWPPRSSSVINFLAAKFLRLDGITSKIRAAIQKLRDKVDKMLDRVVEWIVIKAKRDCSRKCSGRKMPRASAGSGGAAGNRAAGDDRVTKPFALNGQGAHASKPWPKTGSSAYTRRSRAASSSTASSTAKPRTGARAPDPGNGG